MNSQDFFFYSLGIGFLILVGFLSYAAYNLAESLKRLNLILQRVDDISNDISIIENRIKIGLLNILQMFFKKKEVKK